MCEYRQLLRAGYDNVAALAITCGGSALPTTNLNRLSSWVCHNMEKPWQKQIHAPSMKCIVIHLTIHNSLRDFKSCSVILWCSNVPDQDQRRGGEGGEGSIQYRYSKIRGNPTSGVNSFYLISHPNCPSRYLRFCGCDWNRGR